MKNSLLFTLIFITLNLYGCNSGNSTNSTNPSPPDIVLGKFVWSESNSTLSVGESEVLGLSYVRGNIKTPFTITFSTSSPNIISISPESCIVHPPVACDLNVFAIGVGVSNIIIQSNIPYVESTAVTVTN